MRAWKAQGGNVFKAGQVVKRLYKLKRFNLYFKRKRMDKLRFTK